MTTITERPHTHSFSENEIRYVFDVSDPAAVGLEVQVELYTREVGGVAAKLVAFSLYPPTDGVVYCHVKSYLKSILKPQLPDAAGATVQPITSQVAYFYIKYREVTTASPDPSWETDEGNESIVLMGGVEQQKFKRNNFFASYMDTYPRFLTWLSDGNNYVFADQQLYLSFLLTGVAHTVRVSVKVVFTDSTDQIITEDLAAGDNLLFLINAGAAALGLEALQPLKKIWYYEVSVLKFLIAPDDPLNPVPILMINAKRFYIDYRPAYNYNEFIYLNSQGGWDCLRILGETAWSLDVNSNDLEHIIYNDDHTNATPQGQYSQANIFKKDNYKGDAGFQRTKEHQELLIELLISKEIYELVDGRWIKIISLKRSADIRNTADKKWAFPVEWSYGYSDSVFTPKGILLGAGT